MTENESIKKHIEDCEHRIGNILGFMESNSYADILSCEENIAILKEVIIALEEIEQYRAIGLTPTQVKDLIKMNKKNHKGALENAHIIDEYGEIGTVEEFKDLKEKNTEREPLKIKTDEKILYMCPCCRKIFIEKYDTVQRGFIPKYCEMCGQNIKWSWGQ